MNFSQRMGLLPATKAIQRESMDQPLRNSLWNVLTLSVWDNHSYARGHLHQTKYSNLFPLVRGIWGAFFKLPVDIIPGTWPECLKAVRTFFMDAEWNRVYDFVEFMSSRLTSAEQRKFCDAVNRVLVRETAAYRFVQGQIAEITSKDEVDSIDQAINASSRLSGVSTHLTAALTMLSDRSNPDYRNSIKESISAVESLAKQLSGNADGTLGAVLKELKKSKRLHPSLEKAFSALYGYTSDEGGIRHALLDEQSITKADAQFMLVCCSAFTNYCIGSLGTTPRP